MSHEPRTPFNAILGFSQLLEHDLNHAISEVQLGYTRHVIKGGEHRVELIDQVLELSKIEAGQIDLLWNMSTFSGEGGGHRNVAGAGQKSGDHI